METYDDWNNLKKRLSVRDKKLLFKEREVWWMSFGLNLGEEIYGKGHKYTRPALILKKLSSTSCIVLPLSTKRKVGSWFCTVGLHDKIQTVSLYQMRFVSSKRFISKMLEIPEPDFEEIRKAVANFYGFS